MFAIAALLAAPLSWLGAAHDRRHPWRRHRRIRRGAARRHRHAARAGTCRARPRRSRNESGVYRFPNLAPGIYDITAELAGFRDQHPDRHSGRPRRAPQEVAGAAEGQHAAGDHHRRRRSAGRRFGDHRSRHQLHPRVGRERAGAPVHVLRPDQRRARRQPGDVDQLALAVVRLGHQREPVPARRHRLHRAARPAPRGRGPTPTPSKKCRCCRSARRADYGNVAGAVFNVVTRQGTNTFHGDANFYFQNDRPDRPQHHRRPGRRAALQPRPVHRHAPRSSAGRS